MVIRLSLAVFSNISVHKIIEIFFIEMTILGKMLFSLNWEEYFSHEGGNFWFEIIRNYNPIMFVAYVCIDMFWDTDISVVFLNFKLLERQI